MLVKVMCGGESIRSVWRLDPCGDLLSELQRGWAEWLRGEHQRKTESKRFARTRELVKWQSLHDAPVLSEFVSRIALRSGMALCHRSESGNMRPSTAERELPIEQRIEFAKRVQIAG
jgi:hypothetical protein